MQMKLIALLANIPIIFSTPDGPAPLLCLAEMDPRNRQLVRKEVIQRMQCLREVVRKSSD
jgi:hypothetical protein